MTYVVSDDELVFLIRAKHLEAYEHLQARMQTKQDRFIYKMLSMHRYCGLLFDDLKQIATWSLWLAVDTYQPKKNIFDAYYHLLLQREVIHEMKRFNSPSHHQLNQALSLDAEVEDGSPLSEFIGYDDPSIKQAVEHPLLVLLEEENKTLTMEQRAMLVYVNLGYSYTEIGKIMKKSYRFISKQVQALLATVIPKDSTTYD
jgi:DNA-directed RNA polymerase specialized sigma24 family protein